MATKKKKWSIYDEDGNVSAEAEDVINTVLHDYPDFSDREEAVRKSIWDTLHDDNMSKKDFTEHCEYMREFDLEEGGPLDEEEGSMEFPEDPKLRLMTAWVELFKSEMDPFPKKKSEQIDWIAMYGNFFWVAGWALMQLKEEDRDLSWTNWDQLTGDELLTLASEFANYIFKEEIEAILRSNGIQILGDSATE
jgi:hypothetical protein